jgi:tetratricopeptide (TPR) repeat protein
MRLSALLLAGWLLAPATGWTKPPAEKSAAAWVKDGERLYKAGKYREAAEALLKAQALDPHPRLVYNIARAYDQAGALSDALTYYQQYVGSEEGTDPVLLKRSALAIDRLRGLVRQQEEERARQEAERQRQAGEVRAARERAEAEAEAKRRAEADAETQRKEALELELKVQERARTGAYVAGGVALAGLATGATFGVLAFNSRNSFIQAQTLDDKQKYKAVTQSRALIADIGFGVGLAAAVTAVVLYPKNGAPPSSQARLLLGPGGAGVEVRF